MIRPAMYDFFVFFQTKMVGRIRIYHEIKLEIDGNSWDIHIYIYISFHSQYWILIFYSTSIHESI